MQARFHNRASSLADTKVLFNGIPAPIVYTSDKQTSAIVPADVGSAPSVEVQIDYHGARSNVVTLPVVPVHTGMFTADASGVGQVAALDEDGSINSPANPALRGSVMSLFLTGAGVTLPQPGISELVGSVPTRLGAAVNVLFPLQAPTADVDAVLADLLYAGAVPGSVQGLIQLNVRIPKTAALDAAVPVYVEIDRSTVQPGVTVALR